MSIDVTIRQKGLRKVELPLSVILGNSLSYGSWDGLSLECGVIHGEEFTIYNSVRIARGIQVRRDPAKKSEIALRSLTPTSTEELHEFYQCVGRIVNRWKCELWLEGEKISPQDFQQGLPGMCRMNEETLRHMAEETLREGGSTTFYAALWPLVMGREEAALFAEGGVGAFRDWMHRKQSMDVYMGGS